MRSMFTKLIMALALIGMFCSAPAMARKKDGMKYDSQVGRMYFVSKYSGLPGSPQRFLTRTELENVTWFDQVCQGDLKAQRPNGVSEYFHTMVFGALGAGSGYGAGYEASGADSKTVKMGIKLGVGFGLASGLFQGIDGRKRANRYDMGQCVSQMVMWSQQLDHTMLGVFIIINSHAVNGKGMKRMTIADNDNSAPPAAANDNAAPNVTARPVIIN